MSARPVPPRVAAWFVNRVLGEADREPMLGDLEERFYIVAAKHGPGAARRWYWWQALRAPIAARRRLEHPHNEGDGFMTNIWSDIRFAVRVMARDARFTALTVVTLALGIGAATAMYSVVDAVLLRPLPYAQPDRLVAVEDIAAATPNSFPEFVDLKKSLPGAFAAIGAYSGTDFTITGDGEPERLVGDRITANLPSILGITPIRGRVFRDDEESISADRVIMISERLWKRRFASDSSIVGRALTLNGRPWTVVGVFPSRPAALTPERLEASTNSDFWMPLRLSEANAPRGLQFLDAVGKLKPGVTVDAGRAQMAALTARLRADSLTDRDIGIIPLGDRVVGNSHLMLQVLLGAVLLLLLIACANIANLLLAQGTARRREFAVRLALGASGRRVVSQLLVENVLRALVGGALGVGVAYGMLFAMRRWLSLDLPRYAEIAIDARVLGIALAVSVATGIVFGLLPALRTASGDLDGVTRGSGRGVLGSARAQRMRRALVIGELAMSFVLLVGSALLLKSFAALSRVDVGFDARQTVTSYVSLPFSRYPDSSAQRQFYARLTDRLASIPGVEGVAFASDLPVEGGTDGGIGIEGRAFTPATIPMAEKRFVSANYFAVMGARVVAGRLFDASDRAGATPAAVVNETFARRWFPGESAVGKRIEFYYNTTDTQTVVGVVADLAEGPQHDGPGAAVYVPVEQVAVSSMNMLVRLKGKPSALIPALRAGVRDVDALMPLPVMRAMSSVVGSGIARQRATTSILTSFAALALLLASVGLYGVISYSVVQRKQELGIRAALGARPAALMGLVLRQGVLFVGAGVALGFVGTLALRRYVASQLYGITPGDVPTYALVASVLIVVALLAMVVPARRATKSDPLTALRAD